jgi:hypothetical protein
MIETARPKSRGCGEPLPQRSAERGRSGARDVYRRRHLGSNLPSMALIVPFRGRKLLPRITGNSLRPWVMFSSSFFSRRIALSMTS